jgi:pyruvate kinase
MTREEAIKNLDDIIAKTDAVMVARGDLGIEIEGTKVAILQKQIVKKSLDVKGLTFHHYQLARRRVFVHLTHFGIALT